MFSIKRQDSKSAIISRICLKYFRKNNEDGEINEMILENISIL